jgi:hypothetical protein
MEMLRTIVIFFQQKRVAFFRPTLPSSYLVSLNIRLHGFLPSFKAAILLSFYHSC